MKQRNTGLHVGKYRKQPNFKTNLDVMVLPAALIFCALAGLLITVTGLTAILPLFASGFVCLALVAIAKHLRKESFLLPIAILILIIIVSFARATLLNGFAALWNENGQLIRHLVRDLDELIALLPRLLTAKAEPGLSGAQLLLQATPAGAYSHLIYISGELPADPNLQILGHLTVLVCGADYTEINYPEQLSELTI